MTSLRIVSVITLILTYNFLLAQGTVHDVSDTGELVAALSSASSGAVIRVAGGIYTPGGPLEIPDGVTIEGGWSSDFSSRNPQTNVTIIDGNGAHALLVSNGTTEWTIDGLTLTGGITQPGVADEAGNGSVLRVTGGGSGVLRNLVVSGNNVSLGTSLHGTAIWVTDSGSSLIIEGSSFTDNFDSDGNSVRGMISVLENAALLRIEECTFSGNNIFGGLLWAANADEVIISNSVIEENESDGVFIFLEAVDNTITESIIRNNVVNNQLVLGSNTISQTGVALLIENTLIEGNMCNSHVVNGNLPINVLENVTIRENTSEGSRALNMQRAQSVNVVSNSLIENNTAQNESLITLRGGTNEMINTVIRGNVNMEPGDQLLHIRGNYFLMKGVIVEENGSGNAEFMTLRSREVLIHESIIRNNTVPYEMVEVRPDVDIAFEMINTVIYNNSVPNSYPVRLRSAGLTSILNCTFVNNTGGPAIINAERDGTEYRLINNIFSGNIASEGDNPLVNTALQISFEAQHNLVWDWQGKVSAWEPTGLFLPDVDGNIEANPSFVDLEGGNLRITENSPAIDAGMTLAEVTTDILGVERPQGDAYDIGAYEYTGSDVSTTGQLISALSGASPGAVIRVAGGTYTPGGPLEIPDGVTIEGGWSSDFSSRNPQTNVTIIDGNGAHALLVSNGTTEWTIDGLTLTGGITQPGVADEAGNGSVLRVTGGGSGVLRNLVVSGNNVSLGTSLHGTAIWVTDSGSSLIIEGSSFTDNFDSDGNSVRGMISVLENAALLRIEECTFSGNNIFGGLLWAANADEVIISNSVIEENESDGVFIFLEAVDNTITESIIRNNVVNNQLVLGSNTISQTGVALLIENTLIEGNMCNSHVVNGNLPINVLENVTIRENTSEGSRALNMQRAQSVNVVSNSLIENNTAQNESLITLRGGTNEMINTVIRGNVNMEPGDQLLHIRGNYFLMKGVIVEENGSGNAEFMTLRSREVLIHESIIRNNTVPYEMVEVRPDVDIAFEMINTVIYNNSVPNSYPVRLRSAGLTSILNCTFVNNTGGPAIINAERDGTEYRLINNIFSGNIASEGDNPLVNTALQISFEAQHNLVWDWQGKVSAWEPTGLFLPDVDGNIEANPSFVDLEGGNLRITENSPAVDAGMTLAEVTTDILGVERPQGNAYDIGAYEYTDIVSVDDFVQSIPLQYELYQNYPNPFNPSTVIRYSIPNISFVNLTVYDVLGKEITVLVNGEKQPGYHEVTFDATSLPSGIYFYRLNTGSSVITKRLMLVK
jgi:hypothetical protein